ncbi:Swc5p [Rhodotorula paludigena]|uniref:Swc5p n=1 Tax=Rhodotorula paludigena TaxID=86838 RepID=UPI00316D9B88
MAPPRSVAQQRDDPDLLPSDDDDDDDFRLSDHDDAEDSDSDSDTAGDATQQGTAQGATEPALDKAAVDDLWASFNDPAYTDPYAPSTSTSTPTSAHPDPTAQPKGKGKATAHADDDLVQITVEYEFAGERVEQQKTVKRSSAEAQAFFARQQRSAPKPTAPSSASSAPAPPSSAPASKPDPTAASLDALFGSEDPSTAASSSSTTAAPAPPASLPPKPAPPPKRKAPSAGGGGLAEMAATLGVGQKKAKLNTLEKSKLDWNQYVSTQEGLTDTLAHARKDGYLDRRDFLDRVEQSGIDAWDRARQGARRGGGGASK